MMNRLVAENNIKLAIKGDPFFSISKKLIAFRTQSHLKVKYICRDNRDIDIPQVGLTKQFQLSQQNSWLYLLTQNNILEIYLLEYLNGVNSGSCKKIGIIDNVIKFKQNKWGLILVSTNHTIKVLSFSEFNKITRENININSLEIQGLTTVPQSYNIETNQQSERFYLQKGQQGKKCGQIWKRSFDSPRFQLYKCQSLQGTILAIYKDKYVFHKRNNREIDIFNIQQFKLIGRISLEQTIKQCILRQNILIVITNKQNTDFLTFYVLRPEPSNDTSLITNKVSYERGKGDYYQMMNMEIVQATTLLDKKKNIQITNNKLQSIGETTISLVYVLNKSKQKIQIIKVQHNKILKNNYEQQKLNQPIYKQQQNQNEIKKKQKVQMESARINKLVHKSSSLDEDQKKYIQNLIQIKIKSVMKKLQLLQSKVDKLQQQMTDIRTKINKNLQNLNRQVIKQHINKVFQNITPQFQKYFQEMFKQVAGVLGQGVSYYHSKLTKQAQICKDALSQLMNQTFKSTQQIIRISKKEEEVNSNTESTLRKLMQSKRQWKKNVEDYEKQIKKGDCPPIRLQKTGDNEQKIQNKKVFVRADLNYGNRQKQK